MTSSNDRLDRIEALVEQTVQIVQQNAEAIDKLTNDLGRFNQRLDNYEQGMHGDLREVPPESYPD